MKTITLREETYRKLLSLKGKRSFSDVIEELIRKNVEGRVEKIIEVCSSPPSPEVEDVVRRIRSEFEARV